MMWWRKKRKRNIDTDNHVRAQVVQAERDLNIVKQKLEHDRSKAKDLARAVASARRVSYKVDLFTEEISKSFGKVNHG